MYSDIEDMLWSVKHHSDCHFVEPWFGNFYDYMDRSVINHKGVDIFDMSYDQMIKYSKSLKFDQVGHEIHSKQVKAWAKRHSSI